MKKISEIIKSNPYVWAAACAFTISVLLFSVFVGQGLWSDVITYRKSGDDLKQCFPAMLKIQEFLSKHILSGVDTGTFNGATEFFPRSNLPNMYAPFILMAFLSNYFPARILYLILHFLQMFCCIYFSIRLAQRFFGLNRKAALLFASSVVVIALFEEWYLSHYLVATLVCPALYIELCALDNKKKVNYMLYALPYVLCFTSGYITISVTSAVFVFVMTIMIGRISRSDLTWKQILCKSLVPACIGGLVSLGYCLQLLDYVKNVVQSASSSLFDALYYKLSVLDLKRIFSNIFFADNGIEQLNLITLGVFWVFVLFLFVRFDIFSKMKKREKCILRVGICLYIGVILVALGGKLPFVLWFYTFVPVFGSMHLPLRYLIVFLPILYLGLAMIVQYIPDLKGNKYIKIFSAAVFMIMVALLIFASYLPNDIVSIELCSYELIFLLLFLIFIYKKGLFHNITVVCACFLILLPGIIWFYDTNDVGTIKSAIEERSIIYNEECQRKLDRFVDTLDKKERYMFAAFDSVEDVPDFMPGNYQWYHLSEYPLCNYMGYELQLCLPKDYLKKFPWFDMIDWNYVVSTRGDFVILDEASIKENKKILDQIVDWEKSNEYIDSVHRICRLKKFIPFHYTDGVLIEDDSNAMDNGYFYSHDLKNNALLGFQTDDATYYDAWINADVETEVSFLLYPNRFYKYYIDGKRVEPVVEDLQVYLPLHKGKNAIHIVFENRFAKITNWIFAGYYGILAGIVSIKIAGGAIRHAKKGF